jgi:GTPase SAR1 family protein
MDNRIFLIYSIYCIWKSKIWEKKKINKITNLFFKNRENDFSFIVMGNKYDFKTEKSVDFKLAKNWCESNGMIYFETSAKDGINIEEAFKVLAKNCLGNLNYDELENNNTSPQNDIDIVNDQTNDQANCCN